MFELIMVFANVTAQLCPINCIQLPVLYMALNVLLSCVWICSYLLCFSYIGQFYCSYLDRECIVGCWRVHQAWI